MLICSQIGGDAIVVPYSIVDYRLRERYFHTSHITGQIIFLGLVLVGWGFPDFLRVPMIGRTGTVDSKILNRVCSLL